MASKGAAGIDVFRVEPNHPPRAILVEMEKAERNYDVIMSTAEAMIRGSLLFHDLKDPSSMIKPLRELVGQLKNVLAFIRRDLKASHPTLDVDPRQIAPATHPKPTIVPNDFKTQQTLCPLVLFFRIIAQGLSSYRLKVRENSWGPIRPLHDLLLGLQNHIQISEPDGEPAFWPGLSSCIMFHEQDSMFSIASSTPKYRLLRGLFSLARIIRKDNISRLRTRAGPKDKVAISNMERLCKQVARDRANNVFQNNPDNRTRVEGIGATFNPSGQYMPACFLDFWRFDMPRPTAAQVAEAEGVAGRAIYGVDTCAEWELWMIKIAKLKIMPGAVLRHHPLIQARETYPPRTQNGKPASSPGRRTASPQAPSWAPPPPSRQNAPAPAPRPVPQPVPQHRHEPLELS
ncbi:hypothetical protein SLS62_007890 [Diatrype stigma]|uniref:Uncharacterized protein n=1 Tax=Diatrype stigma TaxID=117547 RepID=A0AAN9YN18_9PEZI